jgi:hypothetical protein
VGVAGLELPADSPGNQHIGDPSGAESGALGARKAASDAGLAVIVEAWPRLPEPTKAAILVMIRAAER